MNEDDELKAFVKSALEADSAVDSAFLARLVAESRREREMLSNRQHLRFGVPTLLAASVATVLALVIYSWLPPVRDNGVLAAIELLQVIDSDDGGFVSDCADESLSESERLLAWQEAPCVVDEASAILL